MCRNIRVLYNFQPPTTEAEVRDAALQYVRKVSGLRRPAAFDAVTFDRAVDAVAAAMPIETWSSRPAEDGIESTEDGWHRTLFSETSAAEVTCAIM